MATIVLLFINWNAQTVQIILNRLLHDSPSYLDEAAVIHKDYPNCSTKFESKGAGMSKILVGTGLGTCYNNNLLPPSRV